MSTTDDITIIPLDTPIFTLEGPEYIEVDGKQVPNYDITIPEFGEGDDVVYVDRLQIQQVIGNLVRNAIEAMKASSMARWSVAKRSA